MPARVNASVSRALLRRYHITPPATKTGGARRIEGGREAVIGGHIRDDGQKMVTLTVGNTSESRLCPFDGEDVREVVQRFVDRKLIPKRDALERMVEHLLSRSAEMFAKEPLSAFLLDKIQLHESEYRIGSVHMVATRPVRAPKPKPKRQDRGAHAYGIRP